MNQWRSTSVKKKIIKSLLVVFTLLFPFVIYYLHTKQVLFLNLLDTLKYLDPTDAYFYFCVIYILSCLFFVPIGLPLNIVAGLIWGTVGGGSLITVLATFVAGISFLVARIFSEYLLLDLFTRYRVFNRFSGMITRYDWQFIFAARINPVVPFSISNYLFGLIPALSFRRYITVTMLGNALPSFAFAAIGATLKSVSIYNNEFRDLVFEIGLALLLLSILFFVKGIVLRKSPAA